MLATHDIEYSYREYKKDPLSTDEITHMLSLLGQPANSLLRKRDAAYKDNALTGTESDEVLIPLFAANPTLMERPILIHNGKAVVGRPVENLLKILT